jgi:arylsulfatase A-like enzyme
LLPFLLALQSCGGDDGGAARIPPDVPTNIVIIVADDLGYADLGVQGSPDVRTPRIDSLAAAGARLTNAYVSSPVCSPTRAGLLTGRFPQRFGLELNPPNPSPPEFGLPLGETTLAEELKGAGYVTGLVGKWHLGTGAEFHPLNRGFDEFFGFLGGSHSYRDWSSGDDPVLRGFEPVEDGAYLTDAFSREAVSFIRRHADEPFFLYLSYSAVHRPMEKPPRKYMDQFLDAAGLGQSTLVIFLSDNGAPTDLNGSLNTPLRGGKEDLFEGGIRVPFIVRWDGRIPAGLEYGDPVIQLDVFPTALAAAGITGPADREIDGVNLIPRLDGTDAGPPHAALFWRYGEPSAVRKGDWKLLSSGTGATQLFDLAGDIGETTDLAASMPEIVSELEAELAGWQAQLPPPPP